MCKIVELIGAKQLFITLFAGEIIVNLHYVSFILLLILNKEMVNFSHGVNVVCDGS